ncbi:neuroligin-4, X-linked-like [Palaemon carinicauda]|uniref:neuroligin-4, X-linked-like n=1 Tax=Palaemon carinicauda TaxID=392227 RepID=UPI0035B5F92D
MMKLFTLLFVFEAGNSMWLFSFILNFWTLANPAECENFERTPTISTKYGQLRGFYRDLPGINIRVASYLGIPYATPPVGANRFSPTRALSQWVGVLDATHFGPSCPQRLPDITNETSARSQMPKATYERLQRYLPALKHQDEDCLYLNLYIPQEEASTTAYSVVVFVHGESYEWGSSNLYDGSVLAALGKVIVVTLNYRLGILGFFNANIDPVGRAIVTNFGLMDQLAALHWVQENIVHFGGDPGQVTVMGHGTGAACLNFLIVSPTATGAGLFKRAILMSGSALSSWASVQEPLHYAIEIATQFGCTIPKDLYHQYENLLQCLRKVPVKEIIKVQLKTIGPSVDGVTIKPDWKQQQINMGREGRTPVDVLMGTMSANLFELFSEEEMLRGFDDERRNHLLETFIRNNYRFHLPEITLAIKAAYTDWTRAKEDRTSIRDLTGEALHDASIVSPMSALACQIYTTYRSTYFYVLDHKIGDRYSERMSHEVSMNELSYIFGGPLGAQSPATSNFNFTKRDMVLSEAIITLWTNFMKFGHPRNLSSVKIFGDIENNATYLSLDWPKFDPIHQKYYELGNHGRPRDHYRAGNVALWSWLVPELEKVGSRYGQESSFQQWPKNFPLDYLSGQVSQRDFLSRDLQPDFTIATASPPTNIPSTRTAVYKFHKGTDQGSSEKHSERQMGNELSYTTSFSVTVAIACSLLILNMLVLTIVYYRYDSNNRNGNDMQMGVSANPTKSIYKSDHYSKLSSATLHSDLAATFEGNSLHDWPPDYASSCNIVGRDVSQPTGKREFDKTSGKSVLQVQTASSQCRAAVNVMRQPLASYTSSVDGQLAPLNFSGSRTSEMEV